MLRNNWDMKIYWYEEFNKSVINHRKTAESVEEKAATEIFLKLIESVGLKNEKNKENWNSSSFKQLYNATQRK